MAADNTLTMSVTNPAANNQSLIYTGEQTTLHVILHNATGGDVGLQGGNSASLLQIYMPLMFGNTELEKMVLANISQAGWTGGYDSLRMCLTLTWTSSKGTWSSGTDLSFDITLIETDIASPLDSMQVNTNNLSGSNIPVQIVQSVAIIEPEAPGNADLQAVLDCTLFNDGKILVSTSENPLTNQLFLTLTNSGDKPIYSGTGIWEEAPQISVSFVYGSTSGALAPSEKSGAGSLGSAWNISAGTYIDPNGWMVENPSVQGQSRSPVWILSPVNTNQEVLGTLDDASVTFNFTNIVSLTPPGATQMILQFSGFRKDDRTVYDDFVLRLPMAKQTPPGQSGAQDIWCSDELIYVDDSEEIVPVPLIWSMYNVGSVKLTYSFPNLKIEPTTRDYGTAHPALNYDQYSLPLTGVQSSGLLLIQCEAFAYPGLKQPLNKVEWTVPVNLKLRINSFTITNVPIARGKSSAFRLDWDIQGQDNFEILAYDEANPGGKLIPVSNSVRTLEVNPSAPETTYRLVISGDQYISESSRKKMNMDEMNTKSTQTQDVVAVNAVPPGTISAYAGNTVPEGWLLCEGQTIEQAFYPNLYAAIGNKVPDLRSRFVVGAGQAGTLSNYALNQAGGLEQVTLNVTQIPAHQHKVFAGDHPPFGYHDKSFQRKDLKDGSYRAPYCTNSVHQLPDGTELTGGGKSHENRPPFYALFYMIKC